MALVDKFSIRLWNGFYYCKVVMPDGKGVELKSPDDLTYTQWQEKIKAAWDTSQNPEPEPDECQCPECKANFVCPNNTTVMRIP